MAAQTEPSPARKTSPEPGIKLVRGKIEPRLPGDVEGRSQSLPAGQPFEVHLDLDLRAPVARLGRPLQCVATVLARPLGGEQRETLGVVNGEIGDGEAVALRISARPLPAGIYKLSAQVLLKREGEAHMPEPIEERLESCLVEMW